MLIFEIVLIFFTENATAPEEIARQASLDSAEATERTGWVERAAYFHFLLNKQNRKWIKKV